MRDPISPIRTALDVACKIDPHDSRSRQQPILLNAGRMDQMVDRDKLIQLRLQQLKDQGIHRREYTDNYSDSEAAAIPAAFKWLDLHSTNVWRRSPVDEVYRPVLPSGLMFCRPFSVPPQPGWSLGSDHRMQMAFVDMLRTAQRKFTELLEL